MKTRELSIKSKLLFNNLDTKFKIVITLDNSVEKRKKALNNIFDIYNLTYHPFVDDESLEYQEKIKVAIQQRYNEISELIEKQVTVESIMFILNPVLESLKNMISTCKLSLDTFNLLWKIKG